MVWGGSFDGNFGAGMTLEICRDGWDYKFYNPTDITESDRCYEETDFPTSEPTLRPTTKIPTFSPLRSDQTRHPTRRPIILIDTKQPIVQAVKRVVKT
eukprot:UN18053